MRVAFSSKFGTKTRSLLEESKRVRSDSFSLSLDFEKEFRRFESVFSENILILSAQRSAKTSAIRSLVFGIYLYFVAVG